MQCVILGQTLVQERKKSYKIIIRAMECGLKTTSSMLSFPILVIVLWLYKRMFLSEEIRNEIFSCKGTWCLNLLSNSPKAETTHTQGMRDRREKEGGDERETEAKCKQFGYRAYENYIIITTFL